MGKRIRSTERCPWCQMRYERFRSMAVPDYANAYVEMLGISREAHSRGDYSVNASRGRVLGLMRAAKQAAWRDEHLAWCKMAWEGVPF